MLLKSYSKEVFRAKCNPSFESVHCIASLDQNIAEVLPYLNAVLGGFEYLKEHPAVIFKTRGRIITVHGDKIAINALQNAEEADKILEWLKKEINEAWEKRNEIIPSYEGIPRPKIIEILRLLPKTNCRECGEKTCMVFAAKMAEGIKGTDDCLPINNENREMLKNYMSSFRFEEPDFTDKN